MQAKTDFVKEPVYHIFVIFNIWNFLFWLKTLEHAKNCKNRTCNDFKIFKEIKNWSLRKTKIKQDRSHR